MLRGSRATDLRADLAEPQSAEIVVNGTLDRFGRIDALLNIAGAVPQIDLFEMSDAQWESGLALKLHGARRLTIKAWDALKASSGSVILISGSAALDPKPGFAAVAANIMSWLKRQWMRCHTAPAALHKSVRSLHLGSS
jgi:3-oxoacyl-[acyl-carrier protein] reductase